MIYVRQVDMPIRVRGYTSVDPDGDYNIYINSDLSEERKFITLEHELRHILGGHLESELPVFVLEDIAEYKV